MSTAKTTRIYSLNGFGETPFLFALYFVSGFNALLYQVAWQRMLGLFSGSDVRSVTIIVASYLLGLGLGNLLGGSLSDRLTNQKCVMVYGFCNLGIAAFALASRFLFYDLLFLRLQYLAQSLPVTLGIVFLSLLVPTVLMGISLPMLSKAVNRSTEGAASLIGWLYGFNTLGSGLGTLVSGWYIVGTLGYDKTVYLGASFSFTVGVSALILAARFSQSKFLQHQLEVATAPLENKTQSLQSWYLLVFISGFTAISWEIIWFRVLDIALQSNAYTYGHLLAFVLISSAIGSMIGAKAVAYIRQPKKVFLIIQGIISLYSAIAIWGIGLYWQAHPSLRSDAGFINLNNLGGEVLFKYLVIPGVITIVPSLLMGFYFPLVQQAVQQNYGEIGKRVGFIYLASILGNTLGSLLTGLVLIDILGTAGSIRLLVIIGVCFLLLIRPNLLKNLSIAALIMLAVVTTAIFPSNNRLWAALHAVDPQAYFQVVEDSTSVAAIAETNGTGKLLASGQVQANFPYLHIHGLLGSIPALLHPNPKKIMIIGLGSGGTPHTVGVNPLTKKIKIIELLGAELPVLKQYAKRPAGKALNYLFQDPRYEIIVGDGRRELTMSQEKFDIIEADAIQPWRSRAGMLYSQEFFQEVQAHLQPVGFFVQWDVGAGAQQTMQSVFPYVVKVGMAKNLWILIGSNEPIAFDKELLLQRLEQPQVVSFLKQAQIDPVKVRQDVRQAYVRQFAPQATKPQPYNTDLFPRGEYYLNR
ncbi:spermine synthase [Pleurocapsa sp. CCALA 161]|uniref:fused MFS/spermidine synthase n=1 Tax=Pleurocapsa sp. CCALA 161 TaxID=2107688 RepID=UPI000D057974|nr:fused MFS/spermidine synthase [Pleurocapsa sp. CCALA 161]PSB09137.1 spermine synthase [Pleurocapsa sp. CCALA 161]